MMGKQEGKEKTKKKENIGQERKEIRNKEENWKEWKSENGRRNEGKRLKNIGIIGEKKRGKENTNRL